MDDRRVGTGRPGEITRLIAKTYFDVVKGDTPIHPEWRHTFLDGARGA